MKKLSHARRSLLEGLATYGGSLKGRQLSIPDRRLASAMVADGLVRWEAPGLIVPGTTKAFYTLHITDAGRAALKEG